MRNIEIAQQRMQQRLLGVCRLQRALRLAWSSEGRCWSDDMRALAMAFPTGDEHVEGAGERPRCAALSRAVPSACLPLAPCHAASLH